MPKDKQHKSLLVVRFSALGDVAICVVVLREFLEQNTQVRVTFVSQEFHRPLFEGINRLEFVGVDLKKDYHSPIAMLLLASRLLKGRKYDAFIDLHNVLRTHILRFAFAVRGIPVFKMNKQREQRKELITEDNNIKIPLKAIAECYADVFRRAEFELTLSQGLRKQFIPLSAEAQSLIPKQKTRHWIAIAPFAQHTGKVYPVELMFEVIDKLSQTGRVEIFLFGSTAEAVRLSSWASVLQHTHLVASRSTLATEMQLISHMDLMISMDSANMHIASILGVRTISIWGATHPYAGFMGYGQKDGDAIQLEMECRPCSIFGKKECYKGTYECMWRINPQTVADKILNAL